MSATFTRSQARTIALPAAAVPPGYTLRWPTKAPGDEVDYSLDISAWLIDGDDDIASVSAVIAPYAGDASSLACGDISHDEGIITLWLIGGEQNRDHAVQAYLSRRFSISI